LNAEFAALDQEIGRISETTKFNGVSVLNAASSVSFQVGANTGSTNKLAISTVNIDSTGNTITTSALASAAIGRIDSMITEVTTNRAAFGATQSRFESAINNLQISVENQNAARGRIMDADFAVETANMTKANILQQAGNAMVSQANSAPQSVLQLLG